jgi:Na+-driven multidrug efflux pump
VNSDPDPIQRLFRLARESARSQSPCEPPYGFTTRVLAEVGAGLRDRVPESAWARLTLAALPVAAVATIACFQWTNLTASLMDTQEEQQLAQTFLQTALEP